MSIFPGIAGQFEAVIGVELTTLLLRRWGGCQVTIPVRARGSKLAEVIGEDATEQVIRDIGHGKMTLPCASMRGHKRRVAETREAAIAALRAGASLSQVALEFDLHTRTVSKYRAEIEAGAAEAQMQLPFDRP